MTCDLILTNPEQLFREFLSSHNHPLDGDINYDASRFHYLNCPHGKVTDARYKFFSDGVASGYLKCWRCEIDVDFCSKQKSEISIDEWNMHRSHVAQCRKQSELETQQRHADVATLANEVFLRASEEQANKHDYLTLKQITSHGLRVITQEDAITRQAKCYQGTLLVPCYDVNNKLVNLERIYFSQKENKYQKRPLAGGQRSGAFYMLGDVSAQHDVVLAAEGYASGVTLFEATGYPTAICFSCGNIPAVVSALGSKYPKKQILICADDDKWHENAELRHSGLKAAQKACATTKNSNYILPDFSVLELSDKALSEIKPTDMNDLFVSLLKKGLDRKSGLELVRQQLIFKPTVHAEILKQLISKITPVDFRKLAELGETEKLRYNHFKIIVIEHILELARQNNWGLCRNHDFIYLFNGEYWSFVEEEELTTFLGEAAEAMGIGKFIAKDCNFREHLYKQFIALAKLPKPEQQKDTVLINLKNGTFEITPNGVKLHDFNRADFMTYQLPFDYNPEAGASLFEQYLDKVLPDKALQHILAEYLGYVFIRSNTLKLEKTLLLYGTGANGKSVFYEIVRALLGEQNTSEYSLQNLTDDRGYHRAMLINKLVNYASEINGRLEASIFKQLVSGEPVEARLPYGKPFTLTHYAKLIFNCNELPKDVEQTEAYFRRFLIIPFNVTIPEDEQDKQLAQKIIANELSGVFNWVLQGLTRLLEQKNFTESEAVKKSREQYEKESDSVKLFLEEKGYKTHATAFIAIKQLYPEYRAFCLDDGFSPVNNTNFKKRLLSSKIVVDKRNIGVVAYLSLCTEEYKNFG